MSNEINSMFSSIAKRYDLANDVLSLGMHRLWRKNLIKLAQIKEGQTAIDLCTGTADLAINLKKAVKHSGKVVGIDFVQNMLSNALPKVSNKEFGEVFLVRGDATSIPIKNSLADVVTISFGIRNIPDMTSCFAEIKRILKENGKLVILEFGQPKFKAFAYIYNFYSKYLMPYIGGLLTGNKSAYEYLPKTAGMFPSGEDFAKILKASGFSQVHFQPLMFGIAYIYIGSD